MNGVYIRNKSLEEFNDIAKNIIVNGLLII